MGTTWSRFARIKFCPVLPGSRQCYKLFINYFLRLHVKSFIPTRQDPSSFVLPRDRRYSYYIFKTHMTSICKKQFNKCLYIISLFYESLDFRKLTCLQRKIKRKCTQIKQMSGNCPVLPGWVLISPCNRRVKSISAGRV